MPFASAGGVGKRLAMRRRLYLAAGSALMNSLAQGAKCFGNPLAKIRCRIAAVFSMHSSVRALYTEATGDILRAVLPEVEPELPPVGWVSVTMEIDDVLETWVGPREHGVAVLDVRPYDENTSRAPLDVIEVDATSRHDVTAYTLEPTYVDDRVRVDGNGRF